MKNKVVIRTFLLVVLVSIGIGLQYKLKIDKND